MSSGGLAKRVCAFFITVCMLVSLMNEGMISYAAKPDESLVTTEQQTVAGDGAVLTVNENSGEATGERENDGVIPDEGFGEEDEPVITETGVTSAEELETALAEGYDKIQLLADITIDRTFFVEKNTVIYATEDVTLTRDEAFGGDMFLLGPAEKNEDETAEPVVITFGSEAAEIIIDGNKDSMSVDVTGTAFFVRNLATVNLNNITVQNAKKVANERTLDQTYGLPYVGRVGGAAVILASGTLNIYSSDFTDNEVNDETSSEEDGMISTQGGAIYSFGALNIYGGTFERNSAPRGGAIYNYRETHIYNAEFNENSAAYRGGAIYVPSTAQSKLFLGEENDVIENSVSFDSNTSVGRGGAILAQGLVNVNNTQFTNNSSTKEHGGAIAVAGRIENIEKALIVANSVFSNNNSYHNGGAVYLSGTDAAFTNTKFLSNTAYAVANDSGTRYGGGAVYSTGTISEFDTVEFLENHSDYVAGVIGLYSQSVAKFKGITAASNTADSQGGVFYVNKSELEISDGAFSSNSAKGNGGALYATNGTVKITDTEFTGNKTDKAGGVAYFNTTSAAEMSGVTFNANTAIEAGGAIKLDGASTGVMNRITAEGNSAKAAGFLHNASSSVVNLYNSTIKENKATAGNAGAIYSEAGTASNLYKTEFTANSATGNGGALYMYTNSVESTIHSCAFKENVSENYGGVMYASNKSIVKMYNTTAVNNKAGNGGFIYETTTGTTITLAGLTVSGNTATVGGPIIWGNSTGAVLNIDKTQYFDADYAGEMDDTYWTNAIVNKLTVNDLGINIPGYEDYEEENPDEPSTPEEVVTINVQSAAQLNQAINAGFTSFKIVADFEIDRTFYISDDTHIFSEQAHTLTRAADFTGDIFVVGETQDGAFSETPVTLTVGNTDSQSQNLLVFDGNKDNLSADVSGTVFFIGNEATVNLNKDVTVKNNKKVGNERTLNEKYSVSYPNEIGGAAVIIASGTLNIYGTTILNNTVHDVEGGVSSRGGAIYSFGNLNIYGGTISENTAARGGAIYSYKNTNIYNASITKNSATYRGGAIYMPATLNSRLTMGSDNSIIEGKVLFEENSAADNGGAILMQGIMNANNTTFLKNTSEKVGGAVAVYGLENLENNKSVTLTNSVLDHNTSAGGGAIAFYSKSSGLFRNVEFTNNISSTTGGAVVVNSADIKVYGSTFKNNTASSHGGALIASEESNVYMSNVKVEENSCGANGGAMYSTASKIEIDGAEVKNNSATKFGGAFSMHRATATNIVSELIFNKITASGNTAGDLGGYLYNNHSVLKMYNSDVKNNYSTNHGGAIGLQGVAETSIYNTKFTSNSCGTESAVKNGGAMYVYTTNTDTLLHSCTFDSNSSLNYGGGLYVSNGSQLTMYNTTAKNNTAPKGGFMYETTTGTVATISGLTVSGNAATDGGPIIWGNTTNAKLKINKNNYTDLDHTGEYDSAYWTGAIANKLTVEEISDEVPRYQDYNNELYDEFEEVVDVESSAELEFAINSGAKNIRIKEGFEIDRTFYIADEVVIFTTAQKILKRKADFAGDIFVIGVDSKGNSSIELGKTAKLTLGNQYSETEDLLIIDGNSENMTADVTGTVLFLEESGQIDLYKNVTIQNNHKVGNERILKEKYLVSNANRVGGAAMIISDGTVNVYGAAFKNNICNEELTGEGTTEADRDSSLGGAVYNRGTFNIHSGSFEGNVSARGGAMYNIRALNIYSGQFNQNHATTNGGAIYLAGSQFSHLFVGEQSSTAVSEKILFKGNTSVSNGGALYCSSSAIAMFYGDTTFEANRTDSNGGAIAAYGMVDTNNVVLKNNYAYGMGAGAYIANSNDDLVTRIVTFENTLFENNTARNGGAVAVYASSDNLSEGGIVEMDNCQFVRNKAVNTKDTEVTSNVFGGAIYITRKSTLDVKDSTFEENEALFEGGAIYSAGESETTVTNSIFKKNKTAHESDAKGGAVAVHSATLDFDNVTFTENSTAKNGGAVYVSYTTAATLNSDVNIKNSSFEKNIAGNGGGAIYTTKHTVEKNEDEIINAQNTSFNENTATNGGAVYLTAYSDAYMKDVTFTKNTSSSAKVNSYGGAMYLTNNATAEIDGGQFTQNSSTYCSGAISLHSSARAILNNITATENSAPTSAGFLYVNNSRLDLFESEIKGNTAGVNGGAFAMYNSAVVNANNSVFDGNRADGYGGAIYNTTSEAESVFHTCTFKNNVSPKFGGALYVNNGAILKLYNLTAENNSAQKGGVMYETTTNTEVTINGMTVRGNTATEEGPVIFGNTVKSILNIHKMNYTDMDRTDTADDSYWEYAIENELTVNDLAGISDEIPECDQYISKETETEEEKERVPVAVDDVLSLGKKSSNASINKYYDSLTELDKYSNFMSRSTTVFPNINGEDVSVDTFVSHAKDPANNCTVGAGIMLYQSILYKQAYPEEDVNISVASFRFSSLAAVCINRDSRYFGYMRNLPTANYDKYGFVRISYLLVTAAKMGINVTVVGQLDGYPQPTSAPTLYEYFTYYLDEPCDPAYAEGKFVRDYMTFGYCEWTSYDNKAATDMMHTKMCAVSHYLDMDGNVGRYAVWSSSSNIDGINSNATNGNDKIQTATIVSNHEEIYRTTCNYINIIPEYCGQEEVYNFRTLVANMSKNQIDLIEAGRADEVNPDEQIVYIGTENDDVFELYFSPFGGDVLTWTESYNPYCKYVRKFSNSDDYVTLIWNSANYDKSTPIVLQMENMLTNTFLTKPNPNNKIYINLEDFDSAPYKNLVVGKDIGSKSFNRFDLGALHSKDVQLSYSENGKREYVSILSSINMHGGAMSYQSNYVLIIKEDNANEGSVYFNVADQTSVGMVEHTFGEEKIHIPQTDEDGYIYRKCEYCDNTIITETVHRAGEWLVKKEATETQNGILYKQCSGCDKVLCAKEVTKDGTEVVVMDYISSDIGFSVSDDEDVYNIEETFTSKPKTFEANFLLPKSVSERAGVLVGNYDNSKAEQINIEIYTNGKPRLYYKTNGKAYTYLFTTDIRSNTGSHLAITIDGLTATLYLNGVAKETATLKTELANACSNYRIGADCRATDAQYFRGTIYSVAMFDDVRTAEEIATDMILVPADSEGILFSRYFAVPSDKQGRIYTDDMVYDGSAWTGDLMLFYDGTVCGNVYLAVYEGNKLVKTVPYDATTQIPVSIECAEGQTVKAFWWDSNMKPMSSAVELK